MKKEKTCIPNDKTQFIRYNKRKGRWEYGKGSKKTTSNEWRIKFIKK